MYSWGRKWEHWQFCVPLLSILGYMLLSTLPDPFGLILQQLFPAWFITYTPATLLKGLFIKDRRGNLHWATSGQYTSKFISDVYDCLLILVTIYSLLVGWFNAALNALSLLNEIQTAFALLLSGNFYGFFMGYVASKDRKIHTGMFG